MAAGRVALRLLLVVVSVCSFFLFCCSSRPLVWMVREPFLKVPLLLTYSSCHSTSSTPPLLKWSLDSDCVGRRPSLEL